MKINQPNSSLLTIDNRLAELDSLIQQLERDGARPCPGCTIPCSCSNSVECTCNCRLECINAPQQLSSEHKLHPIEEKVLPLVFTLRQMDVCEPCWSCEGHLDENKKLNKIPQVWFHTSSLSLVRLMDYCFGIFKAKKIISYTWQISVSYTAPDCADNAFTIKPDLNSEEMVKLDLLQSDLKQIAQHLPAELILCAKRHRSTFLNMRNKRTTSVAL